MNRRQALGGALALTLALVAWTAWQDDDASQPIVAARARPAPPAPAPVPEDGRAAWTEAGATALAAWEPPAAPPAPPVAAAPPPPPAAPAPPSAPPFPYRWIGTLQDEAGVRALLASDQRSLGAAAGDTVDGDWRVERIAERRIDLVWLPGGLPVTLAAR